MAFETPNWGISWVSVVYRLYSSLARKVFYDLVDPWGMRHSCAQTNIIVWFAIDWSGSFYQSFGVSTFVAIPSLRITLDHKTLFCNLSRLPWVFAI